MDTTAIESLVEKFHADGFVEIPNVLDTVMLEKLKMVADANFDEAMQIIADNNLEFGIGWV